MHFHVIINGDSGSLRSLDLDVFELELRLQLESAGHRVDIARVRGPEVEAALDEAVSGPADVVMAGGGDGTVSAAAARLANTGKALAVLPAGTMNLFARTIGIPLQPDEAVAAFSAGRIRAVDVAEADGRIFIHQLSIGLHAKLIRLRERHQFTTRLGKIRASCQAGLDAFLRPPRITVDLELDGRRLRATTSSIGVTNNLFGEGHLPYTDTPDGGVLGVYLTRARSRRELLQFAALVALGRWKQNDQVDIHTAHHVRITLVSPHVRFGCAIDGELCELAATTNVRIYPGVLRVLVPAEDVPQMPPA